MGVSGYKRNTSTQDQSEDTLCVSSEVEVINFNDFGNTTHSTLLNTSLSYPGRSTFSSVQTDFRHQTSVSWTIIKSIFYFNLAKLSHSVMKFNLYSELGRFKSWVSIQPFLLTLSTVLPTRVKFWEAESWKLEGTKYTVAWLLFFPIQKFYSIFSKIRNLVSTV